MRKKLAFNFRDKEKRESCNVVALQIKSERVTWEKHRAGGRAWMKQRPLLQGTSLRSLLISAAGQALVFASGFLSFEVGLLINSHRDDRICSLCLGKGFEISLP